MKKAIKILTVVILSAVFIYIGMEVAIHMIRTDAKKARLVNADIPVQTVATKVTTLTEVIGAGGEITPSSMINLTAKVSTTIKTITVDIGDLVTPEQILVEFDSELLEAAFNSARDNVKKAEAELKNSRVNLKRVSSLHAQEFISVVELENAKIGLDAKKAQYSEARYKMVQTRKDLENAILRSPISGIVIERPANSGEIPKYNQLLMTLARIDVVMMAANIAEEKIGEIHIGQKAEVTFNAFPEEIFRGEITKIDPVANPSTRTFRAYIKMANSDLRLKPGMTGFVRIKRKHTALAIPSISIINPVGIQESTIFVVEEDSRAHLRKIRIGVVADAMTEVISGISEGEKVVTVGHLYLKDGDKVITGSILGENIERKQK
ncbi:MAG: efflux RND transporter periplasmic adaptor subunit [Nitrospirota bacterium]